MARVMARWDTQIPIPLIPRAEHNIGLVIPGACERLGRVVKDTADRHLLQKKITKTPTAGVIDLTHADFVGTFWDTLKRPDGIRTAAGTMPAKHVPTYDKLLAAVPYVDVLWYHITGKEIIFKNPATGALTTYATSCIFTASYIPVIDGSDANRTLESALEDQLIDRVAEIVGKLGGLNFLTADPEMAKAAMTGQE
jgi:hypothetical protein